MKLKPILLALCAAAICAPAFASEVAIYAYTGVVDYDEADRGWSGFSGLFSLNRAAIDEIADPSTADYKMSGAPYGMSVVFDGSTAFGFDEALDILVSNNLGGADQFGVLARTTGSSDALGLTLYDFTQATFGNDALPLPAGGLTLAMFDWSEFSYQSESGMLNGHLSALNCVSGCDAVDVQPVPEPDTPALVLAGLGVLGVTSRWRHRRRCNTSTD